MQKSKNNETQTPATEASPPANQAACARKSPAYCSWSLLAWYLVMIKIKKAQDHGETRGWRPAEMKHLAWKDKWQVFDAFEMKEFKFFYEKIISLFHHFIINIINSIILKYYNTQSQQQVL